MPCQSDYDPPSERNEQLQRAAKLLVYVCKKTGVKPELWMVQNAESRYATDGRAVTELCAKLKAMSPKRRDAIVYNAREREARDLANWWEDHQEADARRKRREASTREEKKLIRGALAKLTRRERKALKI